MDNINVCLNGHTVPAIVIDSIYERIEQYSEDVHITEICYAQNRLFKRTYDESFEHNDDKTVTVKECNEQITILCEHIVCEEYDDILSDEQLLD